MAVLPNFLEQKSGGNNKSGSSSKKSNKMLWNLPVKVLEVISYETNLVEVEMLTNGANFKIGDKAKITFDLSKCGGEGMDTVDKAVPEPKKNLPSGVISLDRVYINRNGEGEVSGKAFYRPHIIASSEDLKSGKVEILSDKSTLVSIVPRMAKDRSQGKSDGPEFLRGRATPLSFSASTLNVAKARAISSKEDFVKMVSEYYEAKGEDVSPNFVVQAFRVLDGDINEQLVQINSGSSVERNKKTFVSAISKNEVTRFVPEPNHTHYSIRFSPPHVKEVARNGKESYANAPLEDQISDFMEIGGEDMFKLLDGTMPGHEGEKWKVIAIPGQNVGVGKKYAKAPFIRSNPGDWRDDDIASYSAGISPIDTTNPPAGLSLREGAKLPDGTKIYAGFGQEYASEGVTLGPVENRYGYSGVVGFLHGGTVLGFVSKRGNDSFENILKQVNEGHVPPEIIGSPTLASSVLTGPLLKDPELKSYADFFIQKALTQLSLQEVYKETMNAQYVAENKKNNTAEAKGDAPEAKAETPQEPEAPADDGEELDGGMEVPF